MTTSSVTPLSTRIAIYRAVLFISISVNIVAAFVLLLWPDMFTSALSQPEVFPKTWPRYVGAELLAINFLYFPGYVEPTVHRWPNWCGIVIRLTFALFFFSQGGGFIPMGFVDAAFGLALLFTYLPVVRAAGPRRESLTE
jgi:hypothetical protein